MVLKMKNATYIFILYFCIINLSLQAQSIGDFYQGGVVFYTYPSGGGLIVDIADLSNPNPPSGTTPLDSLLSRWGGYSDFVAGTSVDSIGAGETNTQNFMNFYPDLNGDYQQIYRWLIWRLESQFCIKKCMLMGSNSLQK